MEVAQAQATWSIVLGHEEDAAKRRKLKAETLHDNPKQLKRSGVVVGESSLTMAVKPARMKMQDNKLGASPSITKIGKPMSLDDEAVGKDCVKGNTAEQLVLGNPYKFIAADSG